MKIILCDSAIQARTIWAHLGSPDDVVVTHVSKDFVDFDNKTPFDESNNFAPVWSVADDRAYRVLLKQCRDAQEIILTMKDDWLCGVVDESLRCSGITVPIRRAKLAGLFDLRRNLREGVKIERSAVEVGWRQRIADHLIAHAVGRPIRKLTAVEWKPTIDQIILLRSIADANDKDKLGHQMMPLAYGAAQPTYLGALMRGSVRNSPTSVAEHITALEDYGRIDHPQDDTIRSMREWCLKQFGDSKIDVEDQQPFKIEEILLPSDTELDIKSINPAYRETYTDIWQFGVRFFTNSIKVPQVPDSSPWNAEIGRLIHQNPMHWVSVMTSLRDAGLVFGWSYCMLTDTGMVVDSILQRSWPVLVDEAFLSSAKQNLKNPNFDRVNAISAVKQAVQPAEDVEWPEVLTFCPACRGTLRVNLQQRRVRLVCQNTDCGSVWPAEPHKQLLTPLLPHQAPRWCAKCSKVSLHGISTDHQIRAIRQTCQACKTSQTY